MRLLAFSSLAVLLAAAPFGAAAQQVTPPATSQGPGLPILPGTRVRVSASTLLTPLVANFFEMRGDTAVFIENAQGRGIWTFHLDQITKVERSAGERRGNRQKMQRAALWGAPIGALAFWGFAALFDPSDSTRKYNRTASAGIGAVVGAGVGALVGSRATAEGWDELPIPRRMSFVPGRRGEFAVRWGFSF